MKNFTFLNTDFYQIPMGFAYVVNGINTQKTGFEGFIRHVKTPVNPNADFYIFDGATQVHEYIKTIRDELNDPELIETFIGLIAPKITASNKDELIETFRKNWDSIDKNFTYSVVPNGTFVFPLVPVFQFYGDKFIGQIIETYVTNIYNGRTGMATIKYLRENGISNYVTDEEFEFLTNLMNDDIDALNRYAVILADSAVEFRESTDKILLEAAFRRCPSKRTADIASKTALSNGWNGTSNVSVVLDGSFPDTSIGGTMAHSWVMGFKNENDAFKAWDKIFPGTTMLIDTYNVVNAAKEIKRMAEAGEIIYPRDVRIDSDPMDEYCISVNEIFEGKVGIFVSGDMTPEKFEHMETMNIPFSKSMAGTKYVYESMIIEKLNAGFVYKLVQFEDENKNIIKPEKKATGKKNYPGLKKCVFDEYTNTLTVDYTNPNNEIGFFNMDKMTPNTNVKFI